MDSSSAAHTGGILRRNDRNAAGQHQNSLSGQAARRVWQRRAGAAGFSRGAYRACAGILRSP